MARSDCRETERGFRKRGEGVGACADAGFTSLELKQIQMTRIKGREGDQAVLAHRLFV